MKINNWALYYATTEGNLESAKILISKGKDIFYEYNLVHWNVNWKNQGGNTWLHQAMIKDDIKMIDLLLSSGANPELFNDNGETPIYYASNSVMEYFSLSNK